MKQISSDSVLNAILETREDLKPFLERLNFEKISKYNRGYLKYAKNPTKYFIDLELIRYIHTVNYINTNFSKSISILDIGLFVPVIPIALSKIGFKVCAIEKLNFYNNALQEIVELCSEIYNIEVIDLDLSERPNNLPAKFDLVMLLAVLEHLNGTPKYLLKNIKSLLKPGGYVIIEVPNAVSLQKRLVFFFKGKIPFPPFEDYYYSKYPFSGHNREYSISDLKYSIEHSGFELLELKTFHHYSIKPRHIKGMLLYALELIGPASWKPNIWTIAKKYL